MPIAESAFIPSVIIVMFYQLLFWVGFLRHRSFAVLDQTRGVSVIVAAHNEEANLKKLIPALLDQRHDNFEIIIADDRSNDDGYEHLNSIKDKRLRIVRIDHTPPGINPKKNALNLAIGLASKEVLVLTDADCLPASRNWIAWMAGNYDERSTDIVIGYSGYRQYEGFLNRLIRFETIMTAIQYIGLGETTGAYMGIGRNLSYKRQLFIEKQGFEKLKSVTGGDDDLFVNANATRLNTRFIIKKEAQTISEPKRTWSNYFAQKKRHLSVGRYYKKKDILILGLFSLANLVFWVTFVYNSTAGAYVLALSGYIFRLLTISLTFSTATSKLGERFNKLFLPAMDIIYWIYHSFTAISALAAKRIKWS